MNKIKIILIILFQLIVSFMAITPCLFLAVFNTGAMINTFKEGLNSGSIIGIWLSSICAILGIVTISGGSIMCMVGFLIWIYGDKSWGLQKIITDWIYDYKIRNDIKEVQ